MKNHWLQTIVLLLGLMAAGAAVAQQDNRLLFELLNRIELLEQEVRQLRGDMEVYRYRSEQESADLQAIRQRLLDLEARVAGGVGVAVAPPPTQEVAPVPEQQTEPSNTPPIPRQAPRELLPLEEQEQTATVTEPAPVLETQPAPPPPPPQQPLNPPTEVEQAAYDAAFGRLREGQYEQAVQAFQGFMQQYPNSTLSPNAQYWLGEVYYVMREFNAAQEAFINLGSRYPSSSRLPDALLKLGYIYEEQGDVPRAREVYGKLQELYPGSRPADLAQQRIAVLP